MSKWDAIAWMVFFVIMPFGIRFVALLQCSRYSGRYVEHEEDDREEVREIDGSREKG